MKLKSLFEIQSDVSDVVRCKESTSMLINSVVEKPPISIAARLAIYQDAYRIRLSTSVLDDFGRVRELAGKEKADFLIDSFIETTPSTFRNLAEYSQKFPEFLRLNAPDLFDAGVLDWAEILSEYAAEPDDSLTASEIQAGASYAIRIHPASQLREGADGWTLIYRFNDEIKMKASSEIEAKLFEFFRKNSVLDELSDFAKLDGNPIEVLMLKIAEWIQLNIIYCARGGK